MDVHWKGKLVDINSHVIVLYRMALPEWLPPSFKGSAARFTFNILASIKFTSSPAGMKLLTQHLSIDANNRPSRGSLLTIPGRKGPKSKLLQEIAIEQTASASLPVLIHPFQVFLHYVTFLLFSKDNNICWSAGRTWGRHSNSSLLLEDTKGGWIHISSSVIYKLHFWSNLPPSSAAFCTHSHQNASDIWGSIVITEFTTIVQKADSSNSWSIQVWEIWVCWYLSRIERMSVESLT